MHTVAPTRAESLALQNFERNLSSLDVRQSRLLTWIEDQPIDGEWLFGRDGALTLRDADGVWTGGCSVPRRRSELQLKQLEVRGSVAVFVAPSHAQDLVFALERLNPAQAVIAVVPSFGQLAFMLHCHDFSTAIDAGRLFLVGGSAWDVEFERLLNEQSGLAVPNSFIRLPHANDVDIQPIISTAQPIIARAGEARAAQIARTRETYAPPGKRNVCVVAPMQFRLWNDFGTVAATLMAVTGAENVTLLDSDKPANASPNTLLSAAVNADMLVTMNTARTDLPGILPTDLPWITWLTGARIPSAALAGGNDRLLIAHPSQLEPARRAGWPADQIVVATWPQYGSRTAAGKALSLICDTEPLDTPKELVGYSSHSVLWEAIRAELLQNPFALKRVDDYLQAKLKEVGITDAAFDYGRFVERLIVPAYAQGLARTLAAAGVPFDVWGKGWDRVTPALANVRGPIESSEQLQLALANSAALVHPLVARAGHPVLRTGVPVVAATDANSFVRLAKQALSGRLMAYNDPSPQFDAALIARLVDEVAVLF